MFQCNSRDCKFANGGNLFSDFELNHDISEYICSIDICINKIFDTRRKLYDNIRQNHDFKKKYTWFEQQ